MDVTSVTSSLAQAGELGLWLGERSERRGRTATVVGKATGNGGTEPSA